MFFLNRQGNQSPGIYSNTFPPTIWIQKYFGLSNCIYIDTNNFIYTGTTEGVIRSSNNGNNWQSVFNENIYRAFAHDLKIEENSLFIATNSYGLYELQIPTNVNEEINHATTFQLFQNHPNPFNPTTKIKFYIPKSAIVKIRVYDILGNEVNTILDEYKHIGNYEIEFIANDLSSGVYFYRMISGNYSETKKMILLR
ncbi:MAG: T9SS type A sorting domain-containing protein [Ignavibacteriaceae bacterium]|nr:T9SS type A sorting domain-containing protein [Ignavibacteriaceae bacterium]